MRNLIPEFHHSILKKSMVEDRVRVGRTMQFIRLMATEYKLNLNYESSGTKQLMVHFLLNILTDTEEWKFCCY